MFGLVQHGVNHVSLWSYLSKALNWFSKTAIAVCRFNVLAVFLVCCIMSLLCTYYFLMQISAVISESL